MSRRDAVAAFRDRYGRAPALVVRSPGRVNLIGDHTDYNDGFVMPMAIQQAMWIAAEPRADTRLDVTSLQEPAPIDLDLVTVERTGTWVDYVVGVAVEFGASEIEVCGWNGVISGDIPAGAGLSSSAALEVATARVFAELADHRWDPVEMALLAQRSENDWVGANVGIMDQLISAAAEDDSALLIDCRTLEGTGVKLPEGAAVVVIDSGTRRGLVDSEYNERRATCEEAARICGVAALRDLDLAGLEACHAQLSELQYRRARHVVRENAVTLEAAALLNAGDSTAVGRLMNASHASLREDFETSTDAMDVLAEIARSVDGSFGARMTGGGFGGAVVALVDAAHAARLVDEIPTRYGEQSAHTASAFMAKPSPGTSARWQ